MHGLRKAWKIDFLRIFLATRWHISISKMFKIKLTLDYSSNFFHELGGQKKCPKAICVPGFVAITMLFSYTKSISFQTE